VRNARPFFSTDALLLTGIEDFSTGRGNARDTLGDNAPATQTATRRHSVRHSVDNVDGAQKPREHPAIFPQESSGQFYHLGVTDLIGVIFFAELAS